MFNLFGKYKIFRIVYYWLSWKFYISNISGTNASTVNSPAPVSILGDRNDKLGTDSLNRTKRFTDIYNNNTASGWNAFTGGK